MSRYRIAFFGATGGLGRKIEYLMNTDVVGIGSDQVDITNYDQIKKFLADCPCGIILNAAGYNFDGQVINQIDEEIDKQIDVNFKGFVNILRAGLPYMREQKFGRIITFSSILGKKPIRGTSIYSATKAAVDNLVKTTALENAKYGITVNSLSLGYFDGGMTDRVPPKILEQVLETVPMKRLGKIEEIVATINWLLATEFVTGTNIEMGGGLHI